jgi:hypothetical protein
MSTPTDSTTGRARCRIGPGGYECKVVTHKVHRRCPPPTGAFRSSCMTRWTFRLTVSFGSTSRPLSPHGGRDCGSALCRRRRGNVSRPRGKPLQVCGFGRIRVHLMCASAFMRRTECFTSTTSGTQLETGTVGRRSKARVWQWRHLRADGYGRITVMTGTFRVRSTTLFAPSRS